MGLFRRRREKEPEPPRKLDTEQDPVIGGDRMVFWKTKEQVGDVDYGPVWIANMDGEVIEDTDLWLTYEEAEAFARRRGLPLDEV